MNRPQCFALGLVFLVPASAHAHHSLSAYDTTYYRTIQGTVKEFHWVNPHTSIVLNVADADGSESEWYFEGGSLGRLVQGGFSEDMFVAGDRIRVSYNPNRDDSPGGFFLAVTTKDGVLHALPRYYSLDPE
jgi:hypothetical protein